MIKKKWFRSEIGRGRRYKKRFQRREELREDTDKKIRERDKSRE